MGRVTNALVKAGRWADRDGNAGARKWTVLDGGLTAGPVSDSQSDSDERGAGTENPFPAVATTPTPIRFPSRLTRNADLAALSEDARWVPELTDETSESAQADDRGVVDIYPSRQEPYNLAAYNVNPAAKAPAALPYQEHRAWPTALITDRCKTISLSRARLAPALAVLAGNDPLANEKYESLAVRLFNLASKRGLKTILVTSALEGEGKTTVASNLAVAMAGSSDKRVLLIDGDSKRPSVAKTFGIAPVKGWKELVNGECDAADAIFRLKPSGLFVCADDILSLTRGTAENRNKQGGLKAPGGVSGQSRNGQSGMLNSARPESLIEELKRHFGLIIIDTPPILGFADAQRLAAIADGAILVVRAGQTGHSAVADALKLIPKDRRLGVVLNQSSTEDESSYYGARKYAGQRSGTAKKAGLKPSARA
jgi:Mrp family chromosome partitioning ATPase